MARKVGKTALLLFIPDLALKVGGFLIQLVASGLLIVALTVYLALAVTFIAFQTAWRKHRWIIFSLIAATVLLFSFQYFNQSVVYRGGRTGEELQRLEDRNREVEEIRKEEIRRQFYDWCSRQRSPSTCREISDEALAVEEAIGFDGLAQFAVALGKSEQNYSGTPCIRDHNCFGIGAVNNRTWTRFPSYRESILALARMLQKFGYSSVQPEHILAISRWYKGVAPFEPWVALIQSVMRALEV